MAALHSFHLPPQDWGPPWRIAGAEARHMLRVLRLGVGDEVRVFDGAGREGLFRIKEATKVQVALEVLELRAVPEPAVRVSLAAGFAKSARRGWLLEKAVELGASGVVFWQADRSQGRVPDAPKDSWRDKCLAAAKQCSAARLPDLEVLPGGLEQLAEFSRRFDRVFVLWESSDRGSLLLPEDFREPGQYLLVTGP
ncbi:MAG: RsmE family RNA methyltransferase, partial [Desulfovibrionaceae bacterium]